MKTSMMIMTGSLILMTNARAAKLDGIQANPMTVMVMAVAMTMKITTMTMTA